MAIREAFAKAFPGVQFKRCANPPSDIETLQAFVAANSPPGTPIEVVEGPTAPFIYEGHLSEEQWAMQVFFDDSDLVQEIVVSFYGSFDRAEARLERLLTASTWELSWW